MIETSTKSTRVLVRTKEIKSSAIGEQSVFHRQGLWAWWNQQKIADSTIVCIGAGGLGGNICKGLARTGIGRLILMDGDAVELSNLNRQPFHREDLYKNKAFALANNLKQESVGSTLIEAYSLDFEEVIEDYPDVFNKVEIAIAVVDSYESRSRICKFFLEKKIPVIYSAVSDDSDTGYVFVQKPGEACFYCAKPNELVRSGRAKCVDPSAVYIHLAMSGVIIFTVIQLIHNRTLPWNWRETFLFAEARAIKLPIRKDCEVCQK